ncbi:hypothetical protein FPSE_10141 [Fusarium pseudograminearum CS3096]|uniref:Uncharacterized protein n=1 Tax=Fusarium pseudograminearum (strain CS3096) TaxID=1028729 RepID=K3V856_FUSPC|nr:hypothetical protein FPSE_10141 [Fusarium pseudograminearum CS3096]EKJ69727.1 hypothetical protein FPSE_10141 [Fusarium pseudograminearum CS3096]
MYPYVVLRQPYQAFSRHKWYQTQS